MSYENAPATRLLATHCACCGRPLLDATSVETGVGPDCRAKYGYGQADVVCGADGWTAAAMRLGGASHVATMSEGLAEAWAMDAHRAANLLVRAVATGGLAAHRGRAIAAIACLGYVKLARQLGKRCGAIVIDEVDGRLHVHAPFSPAFNFAVRRVPGARWLAAEKVRAVPLEGRDLLWAALKDSFPAGTPVFGRHGAGCL